MGGAAKAVTFGEFQRHATRVLIAVPDDAIGDVAGILAAAGMHRGIALHTSGARGPEVLAALAAAGVACGTLHPLQTVANPPEGVRVLPGVAFAIDGAPEAAAWAGTGRAAGWAGAEYASRVAAVVSCRGGDGQ